MSANGSTTDRDRQTRSVAGVGLLIIAITFGAVGTWAAVAPLSGAVIAQGVVKVDSNRKTVQHLEGGIIKAILVRDGDQVKQGQPLIEIADAQVSATLDILQGRLDAELARSARLRAEREGADTITFPRRLTDRAGIAEVAELMESERSQFASRRDALAKQVALLQAQIAQIREEMAGLETQAQAEQRAIDLMAREIAANRKLAKQQFVQEVHILGLQRSMEEYRTRLGERTTDMARAKQKITDLELRIDGLQSDYTQQAADRFSESRARLFDLEEQIRPSEDAIARQRIVAPVSGEVVDMRVFTVGGIIAPREPLLDIVPDDNPLIVEARVDVQNVDDVRPGMTAEVRLSAFSARDIPLIEGQVTWLSADRLTDPASGAPYYLARVVIDPDSLASAGDVALYPGMPAEVFFKTGERTALAYLIEPLTASLRRAFREP